ncbi:MAG: restriction endonuclease, partial [Oscillospiraceae bacterium]|nr:restriction endonuclease [Oscillospiraceae bacterium]
AFSGTANNTVVCNRGQYITTAKFSNEAVQFAQRHLQQKIVLVDGEALTALMIEYNLGVSIETTYEIKRMDYDFFNEDF